MNTTGYALTVTTQTGTFDLRPSWAAPYFAVDTSVCCKDGDAPVLYHAESLKDAIRFGGVVFDADFNRVKVAA